MTRRLGCKTGRGPEREAGQRETTQHTRGWTLRLKAASHVSSRGCVSYMSNADSNLRGAGCAKRLNTHPVCSSKLFEPYRWRLYEKRQANQLEEKSVEVLRKHRDGRCQGWKPWEVRTPTEMSPEGCQTSRKVWLGEPIHFGGRPQQRALDKAANRRSGRAEPDSPRVFSEVQLKTRVGVAQSLLGAKGPGGKPRGPHTRKVLQRTRRSGLTNRVVHR